MADEKDYYRILGVLDDAEDVVIRAAYRALAQRYHPDKWKGDPAEGLRRMSEINAAYEVLSDPAKRSAWDATRDKNQYDNNDTSDTNGNDSEASSETNHNWEVATEYHPHLKETERELSAVSGELGFTSRMLIATDRDSMIKGLQSPGFHSQMVNAAKGPMTVYAERKGSENEKCAYMAGFFMGRMTEAMTSFYRHVQKN